MPEPIVQTGDINQAYQWAIETCNKPNVGYWQKHRYEETIGGITYYDCSSFVWYSLYHSGFTNIGDSAFTTHSWSMQTILPQAGFTELSAEDEEWLPGDILVGYWGKNDGNDQYDFQHTEMVYQGTGNAGEGYTMGAHGRDHYPVLADQVSIKTTLSYGSNTPVWNKYTKLYRFGGGATSNGLSIYQASAILGSFWVESKVNPYNYHWNQGSYNDCGWGLGMWTDLPYPSNKTLWIGEEMKSWVSQRYTNWWDGDGQVACLIADDLNIDGTYNNRLPGSMWTQFSANQFPQYAYLNNKYPKFTDFLYDNENTNLEELTRAWFLMWESPGTRDVYDMSWNLRWQAAQDIYDYLVEHGDDDIEDWYYEEGDLHHYVLIPTQKAYDNCVVFFQRVRTGILPPHPHPTPSKKKKMPIWMMLRYY